MPSGHKKAAIKELRARYGATWNVKIIPGGVKLIHEVSSALIQHVFFTFVRDDLLGLRVQPGLGVTFPEVNAMRDSITPRHEHTVDVVTGFVFLNNLLDPDSRQNGGWFFESGAAIQPAFDNFLAFVDATIQRAGFFESLNTLEDYIAAVESQRWAFQGVMPTYLYALIAKGEVNKAKQLAAEHRAMSIQIGLERGFVQRASDTKPYDEIMQLT